MLNGQVSHEKREDFVLKKIYMEEIWEHTEDILKQDMLFGRFDDLALWNSSDVHGSDFYVFEGDSLAKIWRIIW